MKALITGIAGFAGSHLAEHLLQEGHEVSGIILPKDSRKNLEAVLDQVTLREGNILNLDSLNSILVSEQPDWVFHLAAMSSVDKSWKQPALAFDVNVQGGIYLLEACTPLKDRLRIVLVSSYEIFGNRNASGTLTEESPYSPSNPYAVTKLALDLVAEQIGRANDLDLVRIRPMNHTGPRQAPGFVIPDFAKQIAEMELGIKEPVLKVGNLNGLRDFSDVRDMVRAYRLAAERGLAGEAYNVCSTKLRRIQEALDLLLSFSKLKIRVAQDPSKIRPIDTSPLPASSAKFSDTTGWRPEISFERTLHDTLNFWREKVRKGS